MGNSSGDRGEREELLVERVRLIRDLYTVLAKIEIVRGVVEQHNKNRVDLARCKEERAKKAKVILGLYMKQVTNTIAKLDGMQEKQIGVEHMKTALAGGGVRESRGQGSGITSCSLWGRSPPLWLSTAWWSRP